MRWLLVLSDVLCWGFGGLRAEAANPGVRGSDSTTIMFLGLLKVDALLSFVCLRL